MTYATLIKQFCKKTLGLDMYVREDREWATDCYNTIYYCKYFYRDGDIAFFDNFVKRCPIAAKYSDFLLSLLHEMGHIVTSEQMDRAKDDTYTYEEYFAMHDEMIATNWAIQFLEDKHNIKILKWFEEQYRAIKKTS